MPEQMGLLLRVELGKKLSSRFYLSQTLLNGRDVSPMDNRAASSTDENLGEKQVILIKLVWG